MGRVGRRVSDQSGRPGVRGPWRRRCGARGREQRELRGQEERREGPLVASGLSEEARGDEGRRVTPRRHQSASGTGCGELHSRTGLVL
jgi:hypothetical protein